MQYATIPAGSQEGPPQRKPIGRECSEDVILGLILGPDAARMTKLEDLFCRMYLVADAYLRMVSPSVHREMRREAAGLVNEVMPKTNLIRFRRPSEMRFRGESA